MNIDEWKEKQLANVEEAYILMKAFNPTILPMERPWDKIEVKFSIDTFPYDQATDVHAQAVGTGERGVVELTFYYWKGPIHTCNSLTIKTDNECEGVLAILKKLESSTKAKIVSVLQEELSSELLNPSWASKETKAEREYRLAEPHLRNEIQHITKIIIELQN